MSPEPVRRTDAVREAGLVNRHARDSARFPAYSPRAGKLVRSGCTALLFSGHPGTEAGHALAIHGIRVARGTKARAPNLVGGTTAEARPAGGASLSPRKRTVAALRPVSAAVVGSSAPGRAPYSMEELGSTVRHPPTSLRAFHFRSQSVVAPTGIREAWLVSGTTPCPRPVGYAVAFTRNDGSGFLDGL